MTTPLDDLVMMFVTTFNWNMFTSHLVVFGLAMLGMWNVPRTIVKCAGLIAKKGRKIAR